MERLEQRGLLAGRQISPLADPQSGERDRPDSCSAQSQDLDPGHLHDPSHQVKDPLVDGNRDNDAIGRFAQEADFLWNDPAVVDDDTFADPRKLLSGRSSFGQDVVFLGQTVARVHDPIGNIAIVGEKQQALGVAIQSTHRKDSFRNPDQVHHGPAAALVVGRRYVAGWFVQDQIAKCLRS
jgi:hypothetical protein